ncbi:alpha/beta hydrolase [Halomonas dongshanensis]|uniref:Alpha/beta hydrolase n=1 Tax=Halomonas dongshanensis TaxID=2890835 RepID=A0ABT2ED07_9GAMM|nr:alpha/beta hydrolase [Halomonas dongshanensis]MCS2609458.1 alpha/beta hydrolase [Halomonas dongshanensis]
MTETLSPPPLQPSRAGESGITAPSHCSVAVTVLIVHSDTLGRFLPEGTSVKLCDSEGNIFSARIDAEGISRHEGVTPGKVAWQLENTHGLHLVAVDDKLLDPRQAAAAPPEVEVAIEETTIQAAYLPPPISINLRDEKTTPEDDLLSEDQLEQLQLAGNNATLFLHGYNVPLGEYGTFASWEQHSDIDTPSLVTNAHTASRATILQDIEKVEMPVSITGRYTASNAYHTPTENRPDNVREAHCNGSGARNWFVHMEYQLNRAAGMTEEDWQPYTRMVSIAWFGDTGSVDFFQAELNAMAAGRRLVALLEQLNEAGIAINIISHSLGARVVLTALNILGEQERHQWVDNLYLWQPAVADNALVNDASQDSHPLGMGVFPDAHKAARKIVVLQSQQDGILGPPPSEAESFWARMVQYIPSIWLSSTINAINSADDKMDAGLGRIGGAYTKKWWVIPIGLAGPVTNYYIDKAPANTVRPPTPRQPPVGPDPYGRERAAQAWAEFREQAIQEAREAIASTDPLPTYHLLAPLAHHAVVSEDRAAHYIDSLQRLVRRNWRADKSPRAALGSIGFNAVSVESLFIENLLRNKFFDFVDQTPWLFDHSGMKIPSDEVFEKSYEEGILRPLLRESGFGNYEPI